MLVGQILVDFTVIRLVKSEFRCVTYVLCETLCVTQTGRKSPLALLHLSVKTKEANYHIPANSHALGVSLTPAG